MNLKKLRESLSLSQTEFGEILLVSLSQYQRYEKANELSAQAGRILELMIELKKIHGFIDSNVDCIKIKLKKKNVKELAEDLARLSFNINDLLGKFIK